MTQHGGNGTVEVWCQTEPAFPDDEAVGRWFSLTERGTVMHNDGNGYATAEDARQAAREVER